MYMELMQCTRCGQYLPRSKLERMKTGTYSRDRRILRELAARHRQT